MTRKTADMFSQFEHIRERMQQAYRQVLGGPGSPGFCAPYMEPAADVYETADEVIVIIEIAGISGEEIELEIEGRTLVIQGQRRPLPGKPQRSYSQMEIAHGAFRRELLLPSEVDAAGAGYSYRDGIFEVVLPKTGPQENRHLRIVAR
jgi:HSP20 family protein